MSTSGQQGNWRCISCLCARYVCECTCAALLVLMNTTSYYAWYSVRTTFWCIPRLSSLAHIRRPWTLLITQSGLMRLVFVLGTSGEMRLLMALRHEHYAFHMWIHVYESVINVAAIAELQSGGVLAGWKVCSVCVLPWWGELVYSLDKYQPPAVFTIVYVGIIFIHVQSAHILFPLSILHFMYSAEWQQAFTGLAAVFLLSMQLGLAEDMKRSIFTVECQKVKHIDPGLRLIIMSRQASGTWGGGWCWEDFLYIQSDLCNNTQLWSLTSIL